MTEDQETIRVRNITAAIATIERNMVGMTNKQVSYLLSKRDVEKMRQLIHKLANIERLLPLTTG